MAPIDVLEHIQLKALLVWIKATIFKYSIGSSRKSATFKPECPIAVPWKAPGKKAELQFFAPPWDKAGLIVMNRVSFDSRCESVHHPGTHAGRVKVLEPVKD